MATKYPSGIDDNLSLPRAIDLITPVKAEVVNDLRDTIIAIENELGIDPSREFGTVRARLDHLTNLVGTGLTGSGNVAVKDNNTLVLDTAKTLNFLGNVSVTDAGDCQADIEIVCDFEVIQETILVNPVGPTRNDFELTQIPSKSSSVQMFINGKKQQHGVDYTVAGNVVTYLSVDFSLADSDDVEFFYIVTGGLAYQETIAPTFIGDTQYILTYEPATQFAVQMFVNGQKQQLGTDYTVTLNEVTYTGGLVLGPTDDVEFWYIGSVNVCSGSGGADIEGNNVGTGADIYRDKVGSLLNFRGILGTNGITASVNVDNVEVDGYNLLPLDGSRTMTGDLDMGGNSIINVAGVITTHASSHLDGGADELDGYNVALNYTPVNYSVVNDIIGEHIAALDQAQSGFLKLDGSTPMAGALDMGTNNITNVGTINGVTIENHSSRHENGGADEINVGGLSGELADAQKVQIDVPGVAYSDTLPEIAFLAGANMSIAAATVAGVIELTFSSTGGLAAHQLTHLSGGSDELDGYNVALNYTPVNYTVSNDIIGEHIAAIDELLSGGGGGIDHGALSGLADDDHTQYLLVDGTRAMSGSLDMGTNAVINAGTYNGVTVENHSARHENGGADEINVTGLDGILANAQRHTVRVNGSVIAENTAINFIEGSGISIAGVDNAPNTDLTFAVTLAGLPAHASTHISGGSDEIDGDHLDIDWNPTNYTPDITPSEASSPDHLAAHLAGIDNLLGNHATRHEFGGADEIDVTDLSGELADPQKVQVRVNTETVAGARSGLNFIESNGISITAVGFAGEIDITLGISGNIVNDGYTINGVLIENHSERHESGGADEINVGGLFGVLTEAQPVSVRSTPSYPSYVTNPRINFVGGSGIAVAVVDDGYETDVTIDASGVLDAYGNFTDGYNTSTAASPGDTFKFRSANNLLTLLVTEDDVTHGDNLLLTVNEANIDHGALSGLGDNDHPQYLLRDGSLGMTGDLNMSGFLISGVDITNHSARHEYGGADQIDGDHLDIDYVPTNYTRDTTPTEASVVQHLTAHLAGIDAALVGGGVDHGSLSGLADDDHLQYLPVNGSRPMEGNLDMDGYDIVDANDGYFSGNLEVVGKLTVGGIIDPTGLLLASQATAPSGVVAGEGMFWALSGSPTLPYFTDSSGTDNLLVYSGFLDGYVAADGSVPMTGNLDMGTNNITNVGTVDGVDVSAHASRHISAGADEIDGDQLDIDWNPSNYTPTTSPGEVTSVDHLTAHLAGIDAALGSAATDHGALTGLMDDDHTQYALLAGRSGGQTLAGGTASGQNLILKANTAAFDGYIQMNDDVDMDGYDLVNVGTATFESEVSIGASAIDWTVGNKQFKELTANTTFTFTNPHGPTNLILRIQQDTTGGWTITWPASVKWPNNGTAPTLTGAANSIDLISFYYDGAGTYYGLFNLNFI